MVASQISILNAFLDSLALVDKQGTILAVNRAWKQFAAENGADPDSFAEGADYFSAGWVTRISDPHAREIRKGMSEVLEGSRKSFEAEHPFQGREGLRWFLTRVCKVRNDAPFFLVSHIDITARKLAEQKAEESNHMLMRLNEKLNVTMYRLAHDIQSPLNSIKGLIDLKRSNVISLEQTLQLLEKSLQDLGSYLNETISTLDPRIRQHAPVSFRTLLDEVTRSLQYLNAGLRLKTEVRQEVEFYSDISDLRTIFSNIITNSIKYCDEHNSPEINISVFADEAKAIVSIRDNGRGMTQEELKRIFEFGFQANASSAGYGLGLYLVKNAVENTGGRFSVASEPGSGTEFTFEIPNKKNSPRDQYARRDCPRSFYRSPGRSLFPNRSGSACGKYRRYRCCTWDRSLCRYRQWRYGSSVYVTEDDLRASPPLFPLCFSPQFVAECRVLNTAAN
jgi:signal transduction histidine kinase